MRKIVLAISGASGSIYPKLLLDKLLLNKSQWNELAVVMTENAKLVWKTELDDASYEGYPVKFYKTMDFLAPVCLRIRPV
jgi:flavin prenyltransferase